MDSTSGPVGAVVGTAPVSGNSICESMIAIVIGVAVLRLEIVRHGGGPPWRISGVGGCAKSCRGIIKQHIPEVAGLVACLALAVALRVRGGSAGTVDEKTWADIMRQWPILITADSLLALQAMLRLVVLLSAVLRGGASLPLSQESAFFFCCAAIGRVALAMRSNVYMLDGPLGGLLPAVAELASVPLLAALCKGTNLKALTVSLTTVGAMMLIAYRNRLSLAGDALSDGLFIFAHMCEALSAFAYLCRTVLLGVSHANVAVQFGHVMMPLQQVLAAYYFVQAFEFVPELVSSGHPFELLQIAGVAQLGAYAAAAVLHWAEYMETPLATIDPLADDEALAVPCTSDMSWSQGAEDEVWADIATEGTAPPAAAPVAAL